MKTKIILLTVITTVAFVFVAYYVGNSVPKASVGNQGETAQINVPDDTPNKDNIPSNWKTYASERFGIAFRYPDTWTKFGEESSSMSSTGTIIAIEVNLIDTLSHSSLLVVKYFEPNAYKLYEYALSQFDLSQGLYAEDKEQIVVGGNKAIKGFSTTNINGKGNVINPPLTLTKVNFLGKNQKSGFDLQFRTPLNNHTEKEVAKFNQVLSSFKLID